MTREVVQNTPDTPEALQQRVDKFGSAIDFLTQTVEHRGAGLYKNRLEIG